MGNDGLPAPSSSWTVHPNGIITPIGRRGVRPGARHATGLICRHCGAEFNGTSNRIACSDRCRVALRQARGPRRQKTQAELRAYNKAKQAERYKRLREQGLCVRCGTFPAEGWACEGCAAKHSARVAAARSR